MLLLPDFLSCNETAGRVQVRDRRSRSFQDRLLIFVSCKPHGRSLHLLVQLTFPATVGGLKRLAATTFSATVCMQDGERMMIDFFKLHRMTGILLKMRQKER
jgi:hypothetical protein